jgi:hypothetical protein
MTSGMLVLPVKLTDNGIVKIPAKIADLRMTRFSHFSKPAALKPITKKRQRSKGNEKVVHEAVGKYLSKASVTIQSLLNPH